MHRDRDLRKWLRISLATAAALPSWAEAVTQSALEPASAQAGNIGTLWWVMFYVAIVTFAGTMAALAIGLWRARGREDRRLGTLASRNLVLVERLGPAGPDAVEKGRIAIQQYGCIRCHRIPGVTGANTDVGPPLAGIADRAFIAGVLPNTDENMIRWLRFPQRVDPKTAMPYLGVREDDARNINAYLNTLEGDQ